MSPSIPDSVAFNALLDESLDNIYVIDANLRYVRVSRLGGRAVGVAPEQMIGRTWRELGLPPATMGPVEAEWKQILATGEAIRREVDFGGIFYEYVAVPLRAGGAIAGVSVISRDGAGAGRGATFTITLPVLAGPRTNPVPPVLIGS